MGLYSTKNSQSVALSTVDAYTLLFDGKYNDANALIWMGSYSYAENNVTVSFHRAHEINGIKLISRSGYENYKIDRVRISFYKNNKEIKVITRENPEKHLKNPNRIFIPADNVVADKMVITLIKDSKRTYMHLNELFIFAQDSE